MKQQTCIDRYSQRLSMQIIKGKVAVDATAIFWIEMCVRPMLFVAYLHRKWANNRW